jgi:hypothetical protein
VLRLTVSLSLVLGCAVVAGGVCFAPAALTPAARAADPVEDPVADWKQRWDRAMKDSAAEYMKIAKKYEQKLEASSVYVRRFALRYLPEDEENRKFLGYVKTKQSDGTDAWERSDIRRDQLREMSDLSDPKKTTFTKEKQDAERKICGWFAGLAKKAKENGAAKDASPDAKWADKANMAWERVLELDDGGKPDLVKQFDEAHAALGHTKYAGKYVSPFKLQFVKAREARKQLGEKEKNSDIKPADAVEPDGMFLTAGLKGGGAKSTHFVVNTVHGKDVAIRVVKSSEKALNDLVEVYGFPETIRDRVSMKFNLIGNGEEGEKQFHRFLEGAGGMKPAEVQRLLDHHMGGTGCKGEYVSMSDGREDADDLCANTVASLLVAQRAGPAMAKADLGSSVKEQVDDWLWLSMGYDVTKRVLGTTLTTWGTFGRYGEAVEPRPGEDKWVELARRLVQADDDIPLKRLVRFSFDKQEMKPQAQIKGWAFLQFVFEKDPAKAKKFIWNVMANGSPKAVLDIYGGGGTGGEGATSDGSDVDKAMDALDAQYREWIIKGW